MGEIRIEVTIGDKIAQGIVYDNAAGRSFLALLPLKIKLSDYNETEKIGKISGISTRGMPQAFDPSAGDIAYYAPFGNLCFFWRDFGLSHELFSIGRITSGIEIFAAQNWDFWVEIRQK